jgi:hypothetical protein
MRFLEGRENTPEEVADVKSSLGRFENEFYHLANKILTGSIRKFKSWEQLMKGNAHFTSMFIEEFSPGYFSNIFLTSDINTNGIDSSGRIAKTFSINYEFNEKIKGKRVRLKFYDYAESISEILKKFERWVQTREYTSVINTYQLEQSKLKKMIISENIKINNIILEKGDVVYVEEKKLEEKKDSILYMDNKTYQHWGGDDIWKDLYYLSNKNEYGDLINYCEFTIHYSNNTVNIIGLSEKELFSKNTHGREDNYKISEVSADNNKDAKSFEQELLKYGAKYKY